MKKRHSIEARLRAFRIWQKLGYNPWSQTRAVTRKGRSGDFYRGAFNSIPFLNDDAKRTFAHLLLRPGYMIRDYIRGQHERYLAPLTALIVFYAFFALVSAVFQPVQHHDEFPKRIGKYAELEIQLNDKDYSDSRILQNMVKIMEKGYLYLHLDQHPDKVETQRDAAIAALEGTLRSQGIPLFISQFLFLWIAMFFALRRYRESLSACAAASAYTLCLFSFYMLFALLLTWGESTSLSLLLMLFLLAVIYRQWLGLPWKKSVGRGVMTGVYYGLIYGLLILLVSGVVLLIAYLKAR